jgi:Niemann-Pick C1 protein
VLQVVATPKEGGRALTEASLAAMQQLQSDVGALRATWRGEAVALPDVCYSLQGSNSTSPLNDPLHGCLMQSATNYFQDSTSVIASPPMPLQAWLDGDVGDWPGCLHAPVSPRCLSSAGLPAFPNVVLGGFSAEPYNASSLVATWLLSAADAPRAAAWEAQALALLQRASHNDSFPLALAFSAERSLDDQLRAETGADAPAVLLAFGLMFLYVLTALPPRDARLLPRLALAAGGMACVLASLCAAATLAAAAQLPASLIAVEVVPFLVLACGVDNMFVLLHAWARSGRSLPSAKAQEVLEAVGGPVAAAAAAEAAALFAGGLLAQMPAVRAFAFIASAALLFDAVLQLTAFTALLVLVDPQRRGGRVALPLDDTEEEIALPAPAPVLLRVGRAASRLLVHRLTASLVVLCAAVLTCAALIRLLSVPLGLEQRDAIERSSYLTSYFEAVATKLEVGPPVDWVLSGRPPLWEVPLQDRLLSLPCGWNYSDAQCPDSLLGLLEACGRGEAGAACRLRAAPNDPLGDFLRWLDPASGARPLHRLTCTLL